MWAKFLSIVFYNAKRTQNSQLWYETATFEAQALSFKKPFKKIRKPQHGATPTVMRTFVLLEENQLKHAYAPQQRAHQSTV